MRTTFLKDKKQVFVITPEGDYDANKCMQLAKENGYDVPSEAFEHNKSAHASDLKSNYFINGINVFTPCDCNPLSFTLWRGEGYTYTC